jgi:hypothetical protein
VRTPRKLATILVGTLAAWASFPVGAEVPPRTEQFIYAVIAYNGKDYTSTYVREPSTDMYLLADTNNFLSARKVFVYYWPLSNGYRLDTDTLNRRFHGVLHISGHGIERDLSEKEFTYYNLRGEYELNWHVAEGPEANDVYKDYQDLVTRFGDAQTAYQRAVFAYQQKATALADRIAALREKGSDAGTALSALNKLTPPEAPVPPQKYAVPPVPIQQAFIVNLPAGTYRVSFTNPDGTLMQGSEKRLIVITQRSADKVGYEVIPADKWTRPETSKVPSSALYVSGTTDLYLRPFYESEYNDFQYSKLVDNDGTGNRRLSQRVRLQQVPHARVVVATAIGTNALSEQAFAIEQSTGQALGYTIVPWNQHAQRPGDKPDLIAFHVRIQNAGTAFRVSAQDETGAILPGSERDIRVIAGPGPEVILVTFMFMPIACVLVVMFARARWYRSQDRSSQRETVSRKKT